MKARVSGRKAQREGAGCAGRENPDPISQRLGNLCQDGRIGPDRDLVRWNAS
jgi:hypothetical protein